MTILMNDVNPTVILVNDVIPMMVMMMMIRMNGVPPMNDDRAG